MLADMTNCPESDDWTKLTLISLRFVHYLVNKNAHQLYWKRKRCWFSCNRLAKRMYFDLALNAVPTGSLQMTFQCLSIQTSALSAAVRPLYSRISLHINFFDKKKIYNLDNQQQETIIKIFTSTKSLFKTSGEQDRRGVRRRNATTLLPKRPSYKILSITGSENVRAHPCAYRRTRMCDLDVTLIWRKPFA